MNEQGHVDQTSDQPIASNGALTDTASHIKNNWLRILHRVNESAMAHLDLRLLLRELLGRIRDAMEVDNAAILLMDDDGRHLTVYAARGPEEQVTGTVHIPVGRGVAGRIAATATTMIIDDLSQVEVENPLLRATVHSLVGAPLIANGQVIGVIHVDSTRPRHFTEEDAELLQLIAGRAALAIEHSKLYESERAARSEAEVVTRQLRMLQTITDAGLAHAQLQELLHALLMTIQNTMEVDNVAILLPTPDGTALTLYSVHGPEEVVMGHVHVPMGQGVAGRIAATRAPLIVENLTQVPVANPFLQEHFVSLLGVPLLNGDRLVGVVHVDTTQTRLFTEEDSRLLRIVADRIALAIDRAQDFESAQQTRLEAEHQVADLQEATRRMDEFLGIASHELRTPLTSLKTNLQMLDYWLSASGGREKGVARVDRAAAPLLQRSMRSMTRLDRLIGELLDASHIRESRLELQREHTELVALVQAITEEQRDAYPNRELQLEVAASTRLPVYVDADRIGQVVANYLSNAFKYSRATSPVHIQMQVDRAWAKVSVRDYGVGIPAAEQQLIWDRFYRVPGTLHQSGSQVGLGLGLYICRDIVERHGGQVGVQSAPGEGSTFWFTLPLIRDDAHEGEPADAVTTEQGA